MRIWFQREIPESGLKLLPAALIVGNPSLHEVNQLAAPQGKQIKKLSKLNPSQGCRKTGVVPSLHPLP